MKQYTLIGLLFFFSQVSWAGLIELKGSGITQSTSTSPSISFISNILVDTDVADSNPDSSKGLFLNALKGGSVLLNSGRQFNLDMTAAGVTNVETNAVASDGDYALGALRLFLKFVDNLGEMLTLSYFCHTEPAFEDDGFVGAGTSLKGLEGDVWFEGNGEFCLDNCATPVTATLGVRAVPAAVVVNVPEPQPMLLLLSGLSLFMLVRRYRMKK